MQFPDETLMAYADGEVDADTRRRIEAAMVLDPTLAERIEKHRALRADLGAAFGGVLDEPVPEHLLKTANASPATVTDLAAARASKSRNESSPSRRWPLWTALAASLLIGLFAGRLSLRPATESSMFASDANGIVAAGKLSAALDEQLSGPQESGDVGVHLSFRSEDGSYCRTFTAGGTTGFACRDGGQWRVQLVSGAKPNAAGEYRMAGSELPLVILGAIDDVMEGNALDQDQERAARARGWTR